MGMPEEIANAIVFIGSDKASYIIGASLAVDGGMLAGVMHSRMTGGLVRQNWEGPIKITGYFCFSAA